MDKYLFGVLIGPFGFFLATLTALVWLSQSLRFVDLIVNQNLSPTVFLHLSALVLPNVLLIILPIALFAAVIYAFNRLIGDSEVVVMWAAGFGNASLTRPVMLLTLIVTVLSYGLSMYLAPLSARALRDLRGELQTDFAYVLLREGAFNNLGKGLTVFVRARKSNGEMLGLLAHDNRDPLNPVTMMAERGALVRGPQGPRFIMINGNRQQIDRSAGQLSFLKFDKYTLDLSPYFKARDRSWLSPKERSFFSLFNLDENNPKDMSNRHRMLAAAHDRIIAPLYAVAFVLIALAALLSGEFKRRGKTLRIAFAVATVIVLRLLGVGLINLAAKSPWVAAPTYLLVLVGIAAPAYIVLSAQGRKFKLSAFGGRA